MACAVDTDPLSKRRLLSTFFASARLLRGVYASYLVTHFLQLDIFDIKDIARLSNYSTGFAVWGSRAFAALALTNFFLLSELG